VLPNSFLKELHQIVIDLAGFQKRGTFLIQLNLIGA